MAKQKTSGSPCADEMLDDVEELDAVDTDSLDAGDEEELDAGEEMMGADYQSMADADPEEFDADDDADPDDEDIEDEEGDELEFDDDGTLPRGTLAPIKEGRQLANPQPATTVALVALRMAIGSSADKPAVDRAGNGAIRNVAIMSKGPAKGHGFAIDETMLRQIEQQMTGGVAMRYTHPEKPAPGGMAAPVDPLGTHVGRVIPRGRSADGATIRGDIEFGPHATKVPVYGNVRDYLMDLAESDPSQFGLSTVFSPAQYERGTDGVPLGRSKYVAACDLTGDPASNPAGLL